MSFPYSFSHGDPGLYVEIYLPVSYEEYIKDILEKGFEGKTIKTYLKVEDYKSQICEMLEGDKKLRKHYDERVDRLHAAILKGFSIYRGNGVFYGDQRIQRDDVAVIRLMFLPDLKDWSKDTLSLKKVRMAARRYLRFWTHDDKEFLRVNKPKNKGEREIFNRLSKWLEDISLVLNGYVAHRLCREIIWRRDNGLVKLEEEIWISSLRTLAVTKINRK